VFSLGTLLYLVMIGDRPFDGSTDLETLLRVQRGDFKLPSRARPDLLPEISRIIEHAMKFLPDERYATADDMLLDLERVLRTSFGGVGQTELKQYLAELSRRDGVPPIGRANPIVDDRESSGGAALVEGNAVVLADAKDDMSAERTDLAELMSVEGDTRFGRRSVDLARGPGVPSTTGRHDTLSGRGSQRVDMFGGEANPPRTGRRVVEELSIPEGAVTEEAPERFRRRKSRAVPIFLMILVLCGGGFAAAKYLGLLDTGAGASGPAGSSAATVEPPAGGGAPPAATAPGEAPAGKAPTAAAPQAPAPPPPQPAAPAAPPPSAPAAEAPDSPAAAMPTIPPAPERPAAHPTAAGQAPAEKPPARHGAKVPRERNVFKESAKRVRSLSQGLDQFPPGTIQLAPPTSDTPQ
jgi:hypothetical protein